MRVSSDDRVWVEHVVSVEDNTGKVFEVNLMNDSRAWWHNFEVIKCLGSPLEELESLTVSSEFEEFVLLFGVGSSCGIDLDGVINDEVNWDERVDLGRVSTESGHGITHGCQIDNSWYTAKI